MNWAKIHKSTKWSSEGGHQPKCGLVGPAPGSAEPGGSAEPPVAPMDAGFEWMARIDPQWRLEGITDLSNRHWLWISTVPSKPCIHRLHGRFGRTTRFGRTWGQPNTAKFELAASSVAPVGRLVNFGLIRRVNSEFLAHSYISLDFDIVRLIYHLSWCRFSFILLSFSAKG